MATKKSGQGGDAHMQPDKDLYEVIRDQLIDEIESGRAHPAGAFLPSIRELTVERTISTTTARRVLSELVSDGYARAQGTRGYVSLGPQASRELAPAEGDQEVPSTAREVRGKADLGSRARMSVTGIVTRSQQTVSLAGGVAYAGLEVFVRRERASAEVAAELRLDAGSADVIVRRRVLHDAEETPVELRTSYVLAEVAEGTKLSDPDIITESWHTALSINSDRRPTLTGRTIKSRHPTDSECMALRLTPTACVLVRTEITSDQHGTPIDYTTTVWPGESITLSALADIEGDQGV